MYLSSSISVNVLPFPGPNCTGDGGIFLNSSTKNKSANKRPHRPFLQKFSPSLQKRKFFLFCYSQDPNFVKIGIKEGVFVKKENGCWDLKLEENMTNVMFDESGAAPNNI